MFSTHRVWYLLKNMQLKACVCRQVCPWALSPDHIFCTSVNLYKKWTLYFVFCILWTLYFVCILLSLYVGLRWFKRAFFFTRLVWETILNKLHTVNHLSLWKYLTFKRNNTVHLLYWFRFNIALLLDYVNRLKSILFLSVKKSTIFI